MENKSHKRRSSRHSTAAKKTKTQNSPPPTSSKTLEELNDDCFEEIIRYLDFMDILNMAATSQRLNQVAAINFSRKYSMEAVCISPKGIYITSPDLNEQPHIWLAIEETDKFIRHLGSVIGRLTINSLVGRDGIAMAKLIFNNCGDSLSEIVMRGLPENVMRLIKKSYRNVENVYLNRCHLGRHISQMNKWFPGMERLMIYNCEISNAEFLADTFPNLTHLTWEYNITDTDRSNDAFRVLTRCNPQIESLRLDCLWDISFLRHLDRYLKRLHKFELTLDYQHVEIRRKVYFHNVRQLILHLRTNHAMDGPLPFTFKRLAEVHLHLDCHGYVTDDMVDFIVQHRSLIKLNIFFPATKTSLRRMAEHLPFLEILGLSGIGFSSSDAAYALNEFPNLRKFRIFNEHRFDDDLLTVLGEQWHACHDRKFFLRQTN